MRHLSVVLLLAGLTFGGAGGRAADAGGGGAPDAPVDRDAFQRGRVVYLQRCQFCHGEHADGRGPLAAQLDGPAPRDFRQPAVAATPAEHLKRTVRDGGEAVGKSPLMPAWGSVLTPQEIDDVVTFVQAVSRYGHVPTEAELSKP